MMRRETSSQHIRIKRLVAPLDERDLLGLPINVPILSPLLSPDQGDNQQDPTPSPTPAESSNPQPSSDGGGTNGGNPGNGNNGGNNGGGNSGGNSGGSNGGSSNSGSGQSSPSGGGDNGTGNGNGNGGGSQTIPLDGPPAPGTTSIGTPGGDGGDTGSSKTTGARGVANAAPEPSSVTGVVNNNDSSSHTSDPLATLGSTTAQPTTGTIAGLSPTIISVASPSGGTSPKIPSPTTTNSIAPVTQGAIKSGISKGGVAAVVIVLLFFLGGMIVFGLRRRNRARRVERRNQWFGAAAYGSTVNEPAETSSAPSSVNGHSGRATAASRTPSIRSSFGTTIDHGMAFRVDTPVTTPPFDLNAMSPAFPPMAEIRTHSGLAKDPQAESGALTRFSNGSNLSMVSQYLDIPGLPAPPPEVTTPMSVRPFSPSESFMFPKPPQGQANEGETDWHSRSPISTTDSGRTLIPKQGSSLSGINPFHDPPATSATNLHPNLNTEFASVELIRRPFVPTLDDELGVIPGDSVSVVKVFDDGWAYVEKIGSAGARGLIPIDCMRDSGEDLPAFLASKRVSSYYGTDEIVVGKVFGNAV